MNRIWRMGVGTTAVLWLGAATPALAAEDSPGLLSWTPGEYIWTLAIFLGLLFLLVRFVWPVILKGLQDREQKIRADLADAEKARDEAQQTLGQYRQQLAEARREAQKLIDDSRLEAERAAARIKEGAQADISQMRQRAQAEITNAKEQAIAEIYEQTAVLATHVAGQILHREINADDQRDLVERSLSKFAEASQV